MEKRWLVLDIKDLEYFWCKVEDEILDFLEEFRGKLVQQACDTDRGVQEWYETEWEEFEDALALECKIEGVDKIDNTNNKNIIEIIEEFLYDYFEHDVLLTSDDLYASKTANLIATFEDYKVDGNVVTLYFEIEERF